MPLRFNICPHCEKKIIFKIEIEDINSSHYPAPVYIVCNFCKKLSTFYVDSLLRISYKELEKKPGGITTIQTE
ncbi:MAG: hypothetical protein ACFFFT_01005 [Candidatus Thorarchaeota archaeon]